MSLVYYQNIQNKKKCYKEKLLNFNYDKNKSYSSDVYFMGLFIFFIIKS